MGFVLGFLGAAVIIAAGVELGLRGFIRKRERERRRYIWEKEILQVAKDGIR